MSKPMYFRIAVIVLWLSMVAWLIRYEAFPEYFSHSIAGYRGMLTRDTILMDSWFKILFRGTEIGYSHTNMDINDDNMLEHYVINNRVHLVLNIGGSRINVHLLGTVILDITYNLSRFKFAFSSPALVYKADGVRENGDRFKVSVTAQADQTNTFHIIIPTDVILFSPMSATIMKHLRPGQQVVIRTIDPISMKRTTLLVRALRKEILSFHEHIEATVVSTEYNGITMKSWIDEGGNLLRQETPIGLEMRKCTPEEAFSAIAGTQNANEVLKVLLPLLFVTENKNDRN